MHVIYLKLLQNVKLLDSGKKDEKAVRGPERTKAMPYLISLSRFLRV